MEVIRLQVLSDNYIFLLCDFKRKIAAVVDPALPEPVVEKLDELELELVAIFNTHHHFDHIGGNQKLMEKFPNLKVYAGDEDRGRIPGQQVSLKEGDRVEFALREAEVFFLPGHTHAHIAYYFPPLESNEPGELFCGDTLFAGGCGRLFEGTPAQMLNSLEKLRSLPDNTRIWCAHEYTLKNLTFAISVEPQNINLQKRLEKVKSDRSQGKATIPSLLGIEKLTNPFLRWEEFTIQSVTNTVGHDVQTFARLRSMKDSF